MPEDTTTMEEALRAIVSSLLPGLTEANQKILLAWAEAQYNKEPYHG